MTLQPVAVVGVGSIGARHLRVLRDMPGVLPIAISRRSTRLRELAAQGYQTAADIEAAARMGARHCIVATETQKHIADSLEAAQKAFDILVEKPLGVDAPEGIRICAAVRERHRNVYVGCVLRFAESINAFREMLESVGSVHSVSVECRSYLPDWRPERSYRDSYSAGLQGGVLRDLIHELDYAGWIFGWPKTLQARLSNSGRLGIAAEEMADLRWEIPDGPVVSISLDYLTRPSRRRMTASGELGVLEWDGIEGTVTLSLADGGIKTVAAPETRDRVLQKQDLAFVQTATGSMDPRLTTGEDGARTLAICDAARRASENRREETVIYE